MKKKKNILPDKKKWKKWIKKQTIYINENKLNMLKKKDREKVNKKMKKFFNQKNQN